MRSFYDRSDVTPEEQGRRNGEVLTFLYHVSQQQELSEVEQAQSLARVRERLAREYHTVAMERSREGLPGRQERLRSSIQRPGDINVRSGDRERTVLQIKGSWRRSLSSVAAVVLLVIFIGSALLVFRAAQHSRSQPGSPGKVVSTTTGSASPTSENTREKARALVRQLQQEAQSWGQSHLYHDSYDGHTYLLDAGYTQAGLGKELESDLANAHTAGDFKAVIDEANDALFNLRMLEADYNDHSPYNVVHQSDLRLLEHYHLQQDRVVIVSLVEQALRVYQEGKLVQAFLVTTGRVELPTIPGVYGILAHQSPAIFKSPEPKSSPFWYPDTRVNYAILYREGGRFIHDSWWRVNYGPGTQFPHYDAGGDESFAGNGSNMGVNLRESDAAWLFNNADLNTKIVIY